MATTLTASVASPRTQRGMSLVELLVSSAIGIFLTSGALVVYIESRDAIQVSEVVARLQENARFVLATLEPDVRAAGYWGLHHEGAVIEGKATDPVPLGVTIDGDCLADFSLDVETAVAGSNGTVPADWSCIAGDEHQALSDVLVIRRVRQPPVDAADIDAGKIYVRTDEAPRGELFVDTQPDGFSPMALNHELVSNVYYVRPWTFVDANGEPDGIPSLRRKTLGRAGSQPRLVDEEVMPGVDDMQVQFGVDTDGDGGVNLYVDPDNDAVLTRAGASIVAVRLWLLLRAERPETGYSDEDVYTYADVVRTTGTPEFPIGVRRVLVRRTIAIRSL